MNVERCLKGPSCTVNTISVAPNSSTSTKTYFWTKSFSKEYIADLSASNMDGRTITNGDIRICYPKLVGSHLVWGPFEKAYSLWDVLVEADPERLLFEMPPVFRLLGVQLHDLHSKDTNGQAFVTHHYDEELSSYWNVAIEEAEKRNITIPKRPLYQHKNLIHGSFGLGSLNYDDELSIFGWEKSGVGDPLFDLSFLLSELLEMHCTLGKEKSQALILLAKEFCDSYYGQNGANRDERLALNELVIRKAVIHLVMFGFFFEEWDVAVDRICEVKSKGTEFLLAAGIGP